MSAHCIAHYNLRLSRELMETVAKFYVDVVGLEVGSRPAFRSNGLWLYADGKDLLHLTEEAPDDPRGVGSGLTFDHVAIACSNWPEHQARLRQAMVDYVEDSVPGTAIRQVFFRDPAGNGVELIFNRGEA